MSTHGSNALGMNDGSWTGKSLCASQETENSLRRTREDRILSLVRLKTQLQAWCSLLLTDKTMRCSQLKLKAKLAISEALGREARVA